MISLERQHKIDIVYCHKAVYTYPLLMNLIPFSAIIGQDNVKLALILNTVNPRIGGVLIRGEKGTGKSTAARSLARLLPGIEVVSGCRQKLQKYGRLESEVRPARMINLPLGATEEMITGAIDFTKAVEQGRREFRPGLLAEAHRGFLYIDEVNLLADHLADIVLDAAASGINIVEREGISFTHPSRFILIGSMNPEEGSVRAQLLDRFGFCVDVYGLKSAGERVELMELKEAFDNEPAATAALFTDREQELSSRICRARKLLPEVTISGELLLFISRLAVQNRVQGHRADIVMYQGARAHAAFEGRTEVIRTDIQTAARFALPHRSNLPGSCSRPEAEAELIDAGREDGREDTAETVTELRKTAHLSATPDEEESFPSMKNSNAGEKDGERKNRIIIDREEVYEIGEIFPVKNLSELSSRKKQKGNGKRNKSQPALKEGRYIRSRPARELRDVAFDATLRAAAPYQLRRRGESPLAYIIHRQDVYEKVRERKVGNLFLFILDASGSMGAQKRMVATKGAIFSILMDAYQKRDKAAMVTFQKREAKCILPPTSSIDLAGKMLKDLPVGGRTPLSRGLLEGYSVLYHYMIKEPDAMPVVVLITDGKANISLHMGNDPFEEAVSIALMMSRHSRTKYIVVDTLEPRQANLGTAEKLASALGAEYFKIEELRTSDLVHIARSTKE